MKDKWFILRLNPEPWATGDITRRKGGGHRLAPNPNLVTFQNAVREELEGVAELPPEYRCITFYLWREIEKWIDAADRIQTRNVADATNLQKGLEDALQGRLFANDREVRDVRTVIVEQAVGVEPCIIIHAQAFNSSGWLSEIPQDILELWARGPVKKEEEPTWEPPTTELF